MLIKGQKDYPCIFSLENVVLRVRAGSGGAWIDANSHTVARYADKEEAEAVLSYLWEHVAEDYFTMPEQGAGV